MLNLKILAELYTSMYKSLLKYTNASQVEHSFLSYDFLKYFLNYTHIIYNIIYI